MATRTARTLVEIAPGEKAGPTSAQFAVESFVVLAARSPGWRMSGRPRFVGYGTPPAGVPDTGSRICVYEAEFERAG